MSSLLWYPGYDLQLPDIRSAEGCRLTDSTGRQYLDLEAGVLCTSVGHQHPRVVERIVCQARKLSHTGFSYSSEVVEQAARAILELLGFEGGRCVFLCSGSEAVEYCVRVAEFINPRPLLLTMADSYFGAYGSAHERSAQKWHCLAWLHEPSEEPPFEQIGGLLLEPGSSSGFVRFPARELVQNLVRSVKQDNGLLLVNEVTTGIGRTGKWFGYQHYDIEPDLVALGKGIGNGFPVSVAAMSKVVVERLDGRPVPYAQSHLNDPLGAAVAHEVIQVINEEHLIDNARQRGEQLKAGLRAIQASSDAVTAVRARGLMAAVEVAGADRVQRELLQRGFVVCWRPTTAVLRINPSLTITEREMATFLDALAAVLAPLPGAD